MGDGSAFSVLWDMDRNSNLGSDCLMAGGNSEQRRKFRRFLVRKLGEEEAARTLSPKPTPESSIANGNPKRAAIAYLRTTGTVGTFLGIGLTVSSILFWWGTTFLYVGLILWLIDLILERDLTKAAKLIFAGSIGVLILLFTVGIVAYPAPLNLSCNWNPQGAAVTGIVWKPGMSAVVVHVTNPTSRDYDHLDITLWVSEAVVAIKQGTDIPCESVSKDIVTAPREALHRL
jgi:hypothetical protein